MGYTRRNGNGIGPHVPVAELEEDRRFNYIGFHFPNNANYTGKQREQQSSLGLCGRPGPNTLPKRCNGCKTFLGDEVRSSVSYKNFGI